MKLTDVHSYWRLVGLINKVAEEYSNPLTIRKGSLKFDPFGNIEIEFSALQFKNGYWAKIKSYRKSFPDALNCSIDDCLYILKQIIKDLIHEPIENIS